MTYPNQFYPQNNLYQMPPYQNMQAQQRQEQLNQVYNNSYTYNFTRDRSEAERWPIAPGNHLVFEDQNGVYFYTKTLGFAPNDKPVFTVYKREDYVEPVNENSQAEQNPLKEEFEKYKSSNDLELSSLRTSIEELKELINQNSKPNFNKNYNKKGGRE